MNIVCFIGRQRFGSVLLALLFATVFICISASPAPAGDWPNWRGPFHTGASDEKNLPEKFSQTENVLWTTPMPGPSSATPIILGKRVFVSSIDTQAKKVIALCLDRDTGKVLWNKPVGDASRKNELNNYATPSPTVDDKRAVFLYGNGDMAAFDLDGELLWQRNLEKDYGPFTVLWIYGSSPLLHQGKLYVVVLRNILPYREEFAAGAPYDSYLLCVNPDTGKNIWKHIRKTPTTEMALKLIESRPTTRASNLESLEAYTTPIPYEQNGRQTIILAGADAVTGHDPVSGDEQWRQFYNPKQDPLWRVIPSPVYADGRIFALQGRSKQLFAFNADIDGAKKYNKVLWAYGDPSKREQTDSSTPLYYKDRLYMLIGLKKQMLCFDPKTGKVLWSGELGGRGVYRGSPTGADDKIYCFNESGEVVTLAAGEEFKILARSEMGGRRCYSTIAAADEKLFIRTSEQLFCVAKLPKTTN